ncbi:hypothetical protein KAI46_02800 [bacterium]|nr:hypothetical protein [bacterium]
MKMLQVWMGSGLLERYIELFPEDRLNIMISFAYIKGNFTRLMKLRDKVGLVNLDSGTYTQFKNKDNAPHVTEDNYLRYARRYKDFFDTIFNYDADFSTDGFDYNFPCQLRLEDAEVPVVPVVHNITNDEIGIYINLGHEMISLGSTQVKKPGDVDAAFDKLKGRTTKVHLLGRTETKFLTRKPFYSADSSSGGLAASVGAILFWNNNKIADEYGDKTDYIYMGERDYYQGGKHRYTHIDNYECRQYLEKFLHDDFGFTRDDLIGGNGNSNKQLVNMRYFSRLEKEVNKIYFDKNWIDKQGNLLPIE